MTKPSRPAAVTTAAVFNLIFGVSGLFCSLCCGMSILVIAGAGSPAMGGADPKTEQQFEMMQKYMEAELKHIPGGGASRVLLMTVTVFNSILLTASGLGLLAMRRWGRTAALVYCAIAFLFHAGYLGYWLSVGNPQMAEVQLEMERWANQNDLAPAQVLGADPAANNPMMNAVSSFFTFALGTIYAFVLLILMFLPSVRQSLVRRQAEGDAYPESDARYGRSADYDDDLGPYGEHNW